VEARLDVTGNVARETRSVQNLGKHQGASDTHPQGHQAIQGEGGAAGDQAAVIKVPVKQQRGAFSGRPYVHRCAGTKDYSKQGILARLLASCLVWGCNRGRHTVP